MRQAAHHPGGLGFEASMDALQTGSRSSEERLPGSRVGGRGLLWDAVHEEGPGRPDHSRSTRWGAVASVRKLRTWLCQSASRAPEGVCSRWVMQAPGNRARLRTANSLAAPAAQAAQRRGVHGCENYYVDEPEDDARPL